MIAFIDDHRGAHGVEPICKVLPIAPSTYHAHVAKRRDPARLSQRAKQDAVLKIGVRRVFDQNFSVYGVRKVWRQLKREGFDVARCTVSRLMRDMGLQGVIRGKSVKTTISDKAAPCPLDHVNRQFKAPRPNVLWLSDFTYVATWTGFVYVAFVIDAYARRIVGWRVSRTAHASVYATPDGTGVRDYIHVMDLAAGHVSALRLLDRPKCFAINLGTGAGNSVLDVIRAFEKASGKPIPYELNHAVPVTSTHTMRQPPMHRS